MFNEYLIVPNIGMTSWWKYLCSMWTLIVHSCQTCVEHTRQVHISGNVLYFESMFWNLEKCQRVMLSPYRTCLRPYVTVPRVVVQNENKAIQVICLGCQIEWQGLTTWMVNSAIFPQSKPPMFDIITRKIDHFLMIYHVFLGRKHVSILMGCKDSEAFGTLDEGSHELITFLLFK